MSDNTVRLTDVSFSYESEPVLRHISIDFKKNRVCFIMGNNGSGKTTLLRNLMGFLGPQTGVVTIEGENVANYDRKRLSRLVSYVPQALQLNTDFSVIDYLSLGRMPHIGMMNRLNDEDYRIIEKYASKFDIMPIYPVPINKLSGGQKQIVAIVRALVQETPIIILDEPMSALDIGKQVDLLRALEDLTANEGKTVILTTHNPNHSLTIDSDSCFLKQGEVIAYGDNSIINEDILQNVYGKNITIDTGKYKSVVFKTD